MGEIGDEMNGIPTQNHEDIQDSLRSAWTDVLGVDEASLSNKRSFLSQGGDSLAALQLSSKLLGFGHKLSACQIMQLDNFHDIATAASDSVCSSMSGSTSSLLEANEFGLSPIQHWLLHADKGGGNALQHQSQLFLVRRDLTDEELRGGLRMLVETHPMLRARLSCVTDGEVKQFILDDTDSAFSLRMHAIPETASDYSVHIRHAQDKLDAIAGPVFGADLFRIQADSGTINILSLKAHRLVIDLQSWNIITQDLENWLEHGKRPPPEGTSFSTWVSAHGTQTKSIDDDSFLAPPLTIANSSTVAKFWGIENATNTLQDVREYSFVIDPIISTKLLEWQDNVVCVIDVLLGALLFSFSGSLDKITSPMSL
ncbi:hypothetical protein Ct61P_11600 [Colletotrichum tofieldiae]|nr:hypothetical protein Ct61P_11600 [Colletotrichum tofieldiae]